MHHRVALGRLVDLVHHLGHRVGGGVAARHLDRDRLVQETGRQLLDVAGKSGRKHQVLALFRQQVDDALQIGQKAHVQHAVGLVHHQDLRLRQVQRLLLHVVEQAARGGDQDFHPGAQGGGLRRHVHAAEHHGRAQRRMARVGLDVVGHLVGQLAGRRQDQRPHRVPRRRSAVAGMRQQQLDDRQRKAGGLAGAGLRRAHHVAPLQHHRNRLGLDWRRVLVTLLCKRAQDIGGQAKILKTDHGSAGGSRCGLIVGHGVWWALHKVCGRLPTPARNPAWSSLRGPFPSQKNVTD